MSLNPAVKIGGFMEGNKLPTRPNLTLLSPRATTFASKNVVLVLGQWWRFYLVYALGTTLLFFQPSMTKFELKCAKLPFEPQAAIKTASRWALSGEMHGE